MKYIATKNGIVKIPDKKPLLKKMFCKHEIVEGECCSSNGLMMISGENIIAACKKCGKVISKKFIPYP